MRGWGLYEEVYVDREEDSHRKPWVLQRAYSGGFPLVPPRSSLVADEGYGFTINRGQKLILSIDERLVDYINAGYYYAFLVNGGGRVVGWADPDDEYGFVLIYWWGAEQESDVVRLGLHSHLDSPMVIRKLSVEEVAS